MTTFWPFVRNMYFKHHPRTNETWCERGIRRRRIGRKDMTERISELSLIPCLSSAFLWVCNSTVNIFRIRWTSGTVRGTVSGITSGIIRGMMDWPNYAILTVSITQWNCTKVEKPWLTMLRSQEFLNFFGWKKTLSHLTTELSVNLVLAEFHSSTNTGSLSTVIGDHWAGQVTHLIARRLPKSSAGPLEDLNLGKQSA